MIDRTHPRPSCLLGTIAPADEIPPFLVIPFLSDSSALFSAIAPSHHHSFQSLTHSFHRHGGVPPSTTLLGRSFRSLPKECFTIPLQSNGSALFLKTTGVCTPLLSHLVLHRSPPSEMGLRCISHVLRASDRARDDRRGEQLQKTQIREEHSETWKAIEVGHLEGLTSNHEQVFRVDSVNAFSCSRSVRPALSPFS